MKKPAYAIAVDIDGVLCNMTKRFNLGLRADGSKDWNTILDGRNYFLDEPIEKARDWINYIATKTSLGIIYLSGRRKYTEDQTIDWFLEHGFPYRMGMDSIILRPTGKSSRFKKGTLEYLSTQVQVVAHIGDRIVDDAESAASAGIRPLLVPENLWLTKQQIRGGISVVTQSSVFQDMKDEQKRALARLKKSNYWNRPYSDLIPEHFGT